MENKEKRTVSKPAFAIVVVIALLVVFGVGVLLGGVVFNKGEVNEPVTEVETTAETTTAAATTEAKTEEVKLNSVEKGELKVYSVSEDESGFVGIIAYFSTSDKDIDGYEIEITNPYDNNAKTEKIGVETKAVYFGTQDTVYTIKARTYKGDKTGEWVEICSDAAVNKLTPKEIDSAKWDEIINQKGVHPIMENQ